MPLVAPRRAARRAAADRRARRGPARRAPRGAGDPRRARRPAARGRRSVQRARRGRDARVRRAAQPRRPSGWRATCCVAMRVYFEKPRTTTGWKGLINDPHLDGSGDVNAGLRLARRLLLEVLDARPAGRLRVPGPDHAAVHLRRRLLGGDRRPHDREPDPPPARLGPVDAGRLQEPDRRQRAGGRRRGPRRRRLARVRRASTSSGTPAILYTRGNGDCHVILRGGRATPNYDAEPVAEALELLRAAGLPERVMIDLSHDNSGKDPERQPAVADEVAAQIAAGNDAIVGRDARVVPASPGRQDPGDPAQSCVYGQSITDGCIGWDTTVEVLDGLAESVRAAPRRGLSSAGMRIAVIGVGLIGGSIGAGRARAAGRHGVAATTPRPTALARRAGARARSTARCAIGGATPWPTPRRCSWPCRSASLADGRGRGAGRRAGRTAWSATSARPSAPSSPRTPTRASSAAIRSRAPRPPASSTPARTCSTARRGT